MKKATPLAELPPVAAIRDTWGRLDSLQSGAVLEDWGEVDGIHRVVRNRAPGLEELEAEARGLSRRERALLARRRERGEGLDLLGARTQVRVEREDLSWRTLHGTVVELTVKVHNAGPVPSLPTRMQVRAAPFGVFVPSVPVGRLPVPEIPAGGSVEVQAVFPRELLPESPVEVPPPGRVSRFRDFVVAWQRSQAQGTRPLSLVALRAAWRASGRDLPTARQDRELPRPIHWAGNFDVFVHKAEAERHFAGLCRLEPDRLNIAQFVVGRPGRDHLASYRVHLVEHGCADWEIGLHSRPGLGREPYDLSRPLQLAGDPVFLQIETRGGAQEGRVSIEFEQLFTQKKARVEFGFGPDAVHAGCRRL